MLIPLFDFKGFFFFLHFLIQIIKVSQPFSMETVYHIYLRSKQGIAKAFPCFYSEKGESPPQYSSSGFILKGRNGVH